MNQAQFSDLDDEIIADDWLVPRNEISRRRLFKQTAKYNIYKADWFGDVLVYEPASRSRRKATTSARRSPDTTKETSLLTTRTDELRLRLANLDLDVHRQHEPISIKKPQSSLTDSDQTDSAYSSISSTPHYHSKSEFEFPQTTIARPSFVVTQSASAIDASNQINVIKSTKTQVILNKDSYNFSGDNRHSSQDNASTNDLKKETNAGSTWQELNELRLIAHESFMLFMGASVLNESGAATSTTSLVMQMNHPKAVSLDNLLHQQHQYQSAKSPIDRFFTARQYFGVAAKLNICQQIRDAMTYLHGKNIVHGRLTSVNIYIEPNQRVKISLIDNDERPIASIVGRGDDDDDSDEQGAEDNSVEFNAPTLVYLSPELIRTLRVVPSHHHCGSETTLVHIDTNQLTKKSDIFSFGTIVYELFHERLPFEGTPAVEVIYRIGLGQMEDDKMISRSPPSVQCPALVQQTISACWSTNPRARPDFKHLEFDIY